MTCMYFGFNIINVELYAGDWIVLGFVVDTRDIDKHHQRQDYNYLGVSKLQTDTIGSSGTRIIIVAILSIMLWTTTNTQPQW